MTYRDPAALDDGPLIVSYGELLTAVEPLSGKRLWQVHMPTIATRLFRIGQRLLVGDTQFSAADARLRCYDLMTGTLLGEVALGFGIDSGFVRGEHLFIAGGTGYACITKDGAVVWKVLRISPTGWTSSEAHMQCTDAQGNELWRGEDPGKLLIGSGQGLLLGDLVAQPDMYGASSRD